MKHYPKVPVSSSFESVSCRLGRNHFSIKITRYAACLVNGLHLSLVLQPRPYWQKKKPPDNKGSDGGISYKPAMAAPPIAASAETKSKLKAFQFLDDPHKSKESVEVGVRPENSDKENQSVINASASVVGVIVEGVAQSSTQSGPAKIRKDCPQTPLSRLPLADLIGSTEDPINRAGLDVTPGERVYWNHSPHSSDQLSSSVTPAPRRGNKRARSSSPASSSQREVSSHFASKKDVDLDPTQKNIKTPQADPATDLWNRYAVGADNLSPQNGQPLPSFAHLIESPSSHLANALLVKDGSGLRRSLSGGFEFGKSKSKRRRINSVLKGEKDDDVFRIPTDDLSNTKADPRISRVSSLVEKIQENFLKTRSVTGRPAPSSSSPFPEGAEHMVPPLSPPGKYTSANSRETGRHLHETVMADTSGCDTILGLAAHPPKDGDTSDYDDDDIDLGLLLSVEEPTDTRENSRPQAEPIVVDTWGPTHLTEVGTPDHDGLGLHQMEENGPKSTTANSVIPDVQHDEFEGFDDDNDLFGADLEDVVAMYDTQAAPESDRIEAYAGGRDSTLVVANDVPMEDAADITIGDRSMNEVGGVSDDEFGDDIDFEQLAVEFTTTQVPRTDTSSQTPVCPRSFAPSI